ncbi:MAG TPA: MerR family transcriptional regulator [Mycobacteriales bacterium]
MTPDPVGLEALDDRPVYVISVAAELAGMHPQTLRGYDRMGLVVPGRAGRARRYSERDIGLLREIARLSHDEGVGLAGIRRILALRRELALVRTQMQAMAQELAQLRETASADLDAAIRAHRTAARRDLVPLTRQPGTSVVVWQRSRRNR